MNILAHAYLSDRHEGLLLGNFIADFVKGDPAHPRHGLSADVITGIRLHRAIDTFTDSHPLVDEVRDLLHPRCHKYAGVAVDVFFDHFLARHFTQLTNEPLSDFIGYVYSTIERNLQQLPAGAIRMAGYMIQQDWLTSYQSLEGIDRALKGLSRRTAFPSGLDTVIDDLQLHYAFIDNTFLAFWPDLCHLVTKQPVKRQARCQQSNTN